MCACIFTYILKYVVCLHICMYFFFISFDFDRENLAEKINAPGRDERIFFSALFYYYYFYLCMCMHY